MKKKNIIIISAISLFIVIVTSVYTYAGNNGSLDENARILESVTSIYKCPGACLTWKGSNGGGLDCMCHRYLGVCKKWCDGDLEVIDDTNADPRL